MIMFGLCRNIYSNFVMRITIVYIMVVYFVVMKIIIVKVKYIDQKIPT